MYIFRKLINFILRVGFIVEWCGPKWSSADSLYCTPQTANFAGIRSLFLETKRKGIQTLPPYYAFILWTPFSEAQNTIFNV